MAKNVTLTTLKLRVRQICDMEGMDATNGFIDDAELTGYINESYAKLYDLLVTKGIYLYETTTDFTGTGSATYSLPADHYAPIGIFYVDSDRLYPLREIQLSEIHRYPTTATDRASAFRVHGSVVEFYPPPSGGTYRMFYSPTVTDLSAGGDTVNGVNGWEEFIVLDAAIKCLMKEDSPSESIYRERQIVLDRIDNMAKNMKTGPFRVVDVEREYPLDPADWGWRLGD